MPSRGEVLAGYAEDLMVHFDFESSANSTLENRGSIGGVGRIMEEESYVAREGGNGKISRALRLAFVSRDAVSFSYVETDFRLDELGFTAFGREITIAIRVRAGSAHHETILSAAKTRGSGQALSFQFTNTAIP
jgi:hypothetical protein